MTDMTDGVERTDAGVPVWMRAWNGRHWNEMPGDDFDDKKLNHALWRWGVEKYEEIEADAAGAPVSRYAGVVVGGTRLKRVVPVCLHKMGMAEAMAGRPAKAGTTKQRRLAAEREVRVAARMRVAEVAAGLRVLLRERRGRVRGLLTKLAGEVPMDMNTLSRFLSGETDLTPGRVGRVREVLDGLPGDVPGMPFKDWVVMRAKQLTMTPNALRMRLHRGLEAMPVVERLSKRSLYVLLGNGTGDNGGNGVGNEGGDWQENEGRRMGEADSVPAHLCGYPNSAVPLGSLNEGRAA